MIIIALSGRGNVGKTHCLGHLINLMHRKTTGCDYVIEGKDVRASLNYLGKQIAVCTWGDNDYEEQKNLDYIRQCNPDIAIIATRLKGRTMKMVQQFCKDNSCHLKQVEKFVANSKDVSEQEYINHLQAKQMLDYIHDVIEGRLYYVDSITENEENRYHVTLLGTEMPDDGFPRSLSLQLNANQILNYGTEYRIQEDDFVLYRPDSENLLLLANDMPRAAELRNESRALRQELKERELTDEATLAPNRKGLEWVKSYHVNVGHGNCSLILTKYESGYDLWMVDCSTYDYLIRRDYSMDLLQCLKDIATDVNVDIHNLRISRFMLTHTHFDHYNGLLYLKKQGVIDGTTLMYINLHYDCASPVWSAILKDLKAMKCRFIEPVSGNVRPGIIEIYHPECRLYKDVRSVPAVVKTPFRVVSKVNNASVVYGINLIGRIMVLPGDLEQQGFEEMSRHKTCSPFLYNSCFYIVSHHGSINGHPAIPCMNPYPNQPRRPLDCMSRRNSRVILMGRNGAYPGIYSPLVENYWKRLCGGLFYTEKAPHYLELDWISGKVTPK